MDTTSKPVIVCATDFSEHSRRALDVALDLARRYGTTELYLLHVGEGIERPVPPGDLESRLVTEWARLEELAATETRRLADEAFRESGVRVLPVFRTGRAHTEIARFARERRADVVVVGTHGRTGLKRALMGSVAEQVVRHAPCTVVTVRTPAYADERARLAG